MLPNTTLCENIPLAKGELNVPFSFCIYFLELNLRMRFSKISIYINIGILLHQENLYVTLEGNMYNTISIQYFTLHLITESKYLHTGGKTT